MRRFRSHLGNRRLGDAGLAGAFGACGKGWLPSEGTPYGGKSCFTFGRSSHVTRFDADRLSPGGCCPSRGLGLGVPHRRASARRISAEYPHPAARKRVACRVVLTRCDELPSSAPDFEAGNDSCRSLLCTALTIIGTGWRLRAGQGKAADGICGPVVAAVCYGNAWRSTLDVGILLTSGLRSTGSHPATRRCRSGLSAVFLTLATATLVACGAKSWGVAGVFHGRIHLVLVG